MTQEIDRADLNPHYGKVIGFVGKDLELLDSPLDSQFSLLINVGEEDEVKVGENVLVFALGKSLKDPTSGRDLGHFEIVRGRGKVTSVQKRMAVVYSQEKITEERKISQPFMSVALSSAGRPSEYRSVTVDCPFKSPQLGDFVRFV